MIYYFGINFNIINYKFQRQSNFVVGFISACGVTSQTPVLIKQVLAAKLTELFIPDGCLTYLHFIGVV